MLNRDCTGSFPRFAGDWIDAWNNRDIDGVLAHYAEQIRFTSPVVVRLAGKPDGMLTSRDELRAYVRRGVESRAKFELLAEARGVDSATVVYRVDGRLVCEMHRYDGAGRIVEAHAHYADERAARRVLRAVQAAWARFGLMLDTVLDWLDRARERRQLAALDDRLLRDIGISRCDAAIEAGKPFWRD